MRGRVVALAVVLGLAAGCASHMRAPLRVIPRVEAAGATATWFAVKGGHESGPHSCELPCEIELPSLANHRVRIEAPGHLPAVFALPYEALWRSADRDEEDRVPILVPLIPLPQGDASLGQ